MNNMKIDFKNKTQVALLILIALTLCFIFGQSILPPSKSMQTSDEIAGVVDGMFTGSSGESSEERSRPMLDFIVKYMRKIAHFVEHGILGIEVFLLFFVLEKNSGRAKRIMPIDVKTLLFSLNVGLLVGFFDESIQILSGRNYNIIDVWLDFAGYATFTLVITLIFVIKNSIKKPLTEV